MKPDCAAPDLPEPGSAADLAELGLDPADVDAAVRVLQTLGGEGRGEREAAAFASRPLKRLRVALLPLLVALQPRRSSAPRRNSAAHS